MLNLGVQFRSREKRSDALARTFLRRHLVGLRLIAATQMP
jgi:hypothetical protein